MRRKGGSPTTRPAPATPVTGIYQCWHFGCAYQPDNDNQLTLEYVAATRMRIDCSQLNFQWQLGF
jgi:hypothetical protein